MYRIVLDFDDQHEFTGGDVAVVDVGIYVHGLRSLNPQYQASHMISEIASRSAKSRLFIV